MPWPVHPNGLLGAQGDNDTYQISRSLRFNSADSAYLNRTNSASPTNAIKYTISVWAKRGSIGSNQNIIGVRNSATDDTYFRFASTDEILLGSFSGSGTDYNITSSGVFRDPSAWYHIVCVFDSANLTQADRAILYVNGVRQAVTTPGNGMWPQDSTLNKINTSSQGLNIGRRTLANDLHLNAYLTEFNFIDGQALTPSSFGETDAVTGRWKAKAYSGSYGTNGFYLKFADNSSAAALGTDSSGNGNTWTVNNFVVSPVDGAGNDSLVDSPTNYGSDSGAGGTVRGNYCTLNPLVPADSSGQQGTSALSNGNLSVKGYNASFNFWATATLSTPISGKWYFEVTSINQTDFQSVGILDASGKLQPADSSFFRCYLTSGNKNTAAGTVGSVSYGNSWTTNDVIGVAIDADNGALYFSKNGTWQNSGVPTSGASKTGAAYTDIGSRSLFPAVFCGSTVTNEVAANFGQRPFAYTAPSGFKALCTTNLSTPTIKKPSTAMDVVTYTGTGASNSISSLGFSPDLVWIKNRGGATSHALYDTVRGVQAQLSSDTTGSEVTSSTGLTAFSSNGFTIGTSTLVNTSGTQYVAWSWDAGSSDATNNSGSITSTVRANPQDGVSVVTFTDPNTSNYTVGHGLSVVPAMVISKNRTGSIENWIVYHKNANASPATGALFLDTTNAFTSNSAYFNNTAPTSTVFTLGAYSGSKQRVAYCFAEVEGFSKFGSYTGNGSADGPFVYCGFRPRYFIIKRTDSTGGWWTWDSARNTFNAANSIFRANLTNAEDTDSTNYNMDFLSNGIKVRATSFTADGGMNVSGATYIFAAFAEAPFKYARAR
jgi:hypothetical protein